MQRRGARLCLRHCRCGGSGARGWVVGGVRTGEDCISRVCACARLQLRERREVVELEEGAEPAAFWDFLGGKTDYGAEGFHDAVPRNPRLFQISNATGQVTVEEIFNYAQGVCARVVGSRWSAWDADARPRR